MIVRALLAYADSEFSRFTPESVPRADALFVKALELLDSPDLNYRDPLCDAIIGSLESRSATMRSSGCGWDPRPAGGSTTSRP